MRNVYFYDGSFVRGDEPIVRLEDRGYQFGDGVYDAWMIHRGRHFLRGEHLDRLEESCAAIGIAPCFSRAQVEAFSDELLARCPADLGVVYFQWTRGWQSPRKRAGVPELKPVLSGYAREIEPYPAEYFSKGVDAILYPDERHHYCNIKTLNLLGNVLASNAASAAGCHEAIFVREAEGKRFVTESAHSNCYAVKDGAVYTAPLCKLILPGVTRRVVLDLARESGIEVVEEFRSPEFYETADEAFLTAASGILPIGRIGGRPIGSGERPVYAALERGYRALVEANGRAG